MKAVYKMTISMRRSGDIEGVFIAEKEHIDYLVLSEIEIYFGEIAGKHSEVYGSIGKDEIKMITDDPKVVSVIEEYNLSSGYNPLNYTTINTGDEYQDLTAREVIIDKLNKRKKAKK